MKALVYVRISELTDATTSPERQRAEGEAWVSRQEGQLVEVIEDLDVSGFHTGTERPGLARALGLIEQGQADTLVIWKIDRLARSIVTFHQVLDRIEAVNGRLVSISESLDFGTPAGRLVASVLASFAEFESQTISSRVKAAQTHLEREGKWRGGRRLYGWEGSEAEDGKGRELQINEEEAAYIRQAVALILQGKTVSEAVAAIHKAGSVTTSGRAWTRQGFRRVLTNPRTRQIVGNDWVALQKLLTSRERAGRVLVRRGLLTELGPVCGACGGRMQESVKDGRRIYHCQNGNPGEGYCGKSVMADRAEEVVIETILGTAGKLPMHVTETQVVDDYAEVRNELQAALVALEEDRYIHRLFRTDADLDRFRVMHERINLELEQLPRPRIVDTSVVVPAGMTFQEYWEESEHDKRRELVAHMLERVVVEPATSTAWNPDRVKVYFRR